MKRRRSYLLLSAAALVLLAGQVGAVCVDYEEYLHRLGVAPPSEGYAVDVAQVGSRALIVLGEDGGVQVFDVTDPAHPADLGTLSTPRGAWGITAAGDFAYVAGYPGLLVLDLSGPGLPDIVGSVELPGSPVRIAVLGDYAFVCAMEAGLEVVDISLPAQPVLAATIAVAGGARGLTIAGSRAYVVNSAGRLAVFDLAVPAQPQLLGDILLPGRGNAVAVMGELALIATDSPDLLHVVDVSDAAQPSLLSDFGLSGSGFCVAIAEEAALVGVQGEGLQAVQLTDPLDPQPTGGTAILGSPWAIAVEAGVAFLAVDSNGLMTVDVDPPLGVPVLGSTAVSSGWQVGLAAQGELAVTVDEFKLSVVDLSDPTQPFVVGSMELGWTLVDLALHGDLALAIGGQDFAGRLYAIDIADPAFPLVLDSQFFWGQPTGLAIAGDYIFINTMQEGVLIFSVSPQGQLAVVGQLPFAESNTGPIATLGSLAMADRGEELAFIDVGEPSAPRLLITLVMQVEGLSAAGEYLCYTSRHELGLIDVTDPLHPIVAGSVELDWGSESLAIHGSVAYLSGLRVFDISDPSQLRHLGGLEVPDGATYVAVGGGVASLLSFGGELFTVPLQCQTPTSAPASPAGEAGYRVQAFPNPFNPATEIRLTLAKGGPISLRIVDITGRLERILVDRADYPPGESRLVWDGCGGAGYRLPSGRYFLVLEAGGQRLAGSVVLLK